MVKHRGLATALMSLVLCGLYTLLLIFNTGIILMMIAYLILILFSHVFVSNAPSRIIAPHIKTLDDGDPYPFLEAVEGVLSIKNAKMTETMRVVMLINHGVALRSIGKYDETLELLTSVNVEKSASILPIHKFIYYNNLADICTVTENFEQADIWHHKMNQALEAIKNKKTLKKTELSVVAAEAKKCYRHGQYGEVIALSHKIYKMPGRNTRANVAVGLLCAKAYIKLGDPEQARNMLGHVIKYGGKLYEVTEAQRLLAELDGKQSKEIFIVIRKSTLNDLDALMPIFDEARGTIAKLGIDQWQNGYPSRDVIADDVAKERSYVVEVNGNIRGTFVLVDDGEVTYDQIYDGHWLTGDDSQNYIAIHRVAISVVSRGSGISTEIINYASEYAKKLGRASLRIDTHEGNVVMRRMLEKHGFSLCGTIHLQNGDLRVAYEKEID